MKKGLKILWSILVSLTIVVGTCTIPVFASDNITNINIEATYGQTEARTMLKMINDWRTGDDAWYWSDQTSTNKIWFNTNSSNQLSELTYDYALEQIAMIRAAEIAISFAHTRPNGEDCYSATYKGVRSYGENIAIGYTSASAVFVGWQETNKDYSGQGHRRNMLNSRFNAIGIGHAVVNGIHCWVQEFGSTNSNTGFITANDAIKLVPVEVANESIVSATYDTNISSIKMEINTQKEVPGVNINITLNDTFISSVSASMLPQWVSENSQIVSITNGIITAHKTGTTKLKAIIDGKTVEVEIEVLPCTNHSFDSGKVTKEPTCKEEGIRTYTCIKCGYTKTETINKTDKHTAVADAAVEATCTKEGKTEGSHCSVCGTVIVEQKIIPAKGHDNNVVIKPATCKEEGEKIYTCKVCGFTEREVIDKTDHSYDSGKVTKEPTCKEEGIKTYTCEVCGYTKTETIDKTDKHTPVADAAVEATCTKEGKTEGSHCKVCGTVIVEQKTVPAKGHDNNVVIKLATCKEEGEKIYTCKVCGFTKTEVIDKVDHVWVDKEIILEPTCTEKGSKIVGCLNCDTTKTETIPEIGHLFNEGKIIKEATCNSVEEVLYTCTVCEETYVATLNALEHEYTYKDNGNGTHTVTCVNCKESYVENHDYKNDICSLCDAKNEVSVVEVQKPSINNNDKANQTAIKTGDDQIDLSVYGMLGVLSLIAGMFISKRKWQINKK